MKKIWMFAILGTLSLSVIGCGDPCKEDAFTKIGDSMATMGKKDLDKNRILAERKAERAGACAEKTGSEMKKDLGF